MIRTDHDSCAIDHLGGSLIRCRDVSGVARMVDRWTSPKVDPGGASSIEWSSQSELRHVF